MSALAIAPDVMRGYLDTAHRLWLTEESERQARRARAWELARRAATLLKTRFGAERVVAFGSLIQLDRFTRWSDVDLAAWGLTAANWLKASGAVRALADDLDLNLVDVSCCSPELLEVIEREGVPL